MIQFTIQCTKKFTRRVSTEKERERLIETSRSQASPEEWEGLSGRRLKVRKRKRKTQDEHNVFLVCRYSLGPRDFSRFRKCRFGGWSKLKEKKNVCEKSCWQQKIHVVEAQLQRGGRGSFKGQIRTARLFFFLQCQGYSNNIDRGMHSARPLITKNHGAESR